MIDIQLVMNSRLRLPRRVALERGADAAAARVAHDHDVLDAQIERGELQRRRHAVILAGRLVGRHQVGDVAHDEQLARHRREDRLRIDPAVAARHDHHLGVLAVRGQIRVVVDVRREMAELEPAVAVGQDVRAGGLMRGLRLALGVWQSAAQHEIAQHRRDDRAGDARRSGCRRRCRRRGRPACR